MSILVLNAGSSSLKFSLFAVGPGEVIAYGQVSWTGEGGTGELHFGAAPVLSAPVQAADHRQATGWVLEAIEKQLKTSAITVVGHRVVHGGTVYRESVLIDAEVRAEIEHLAQLAPLHNPPALATIAAAGRHLPGIPQVAVFDTAFFADLPPKTYLYPLPYEWYSQFGVRRFGFHGISHAYCAGRAGQMLAQRTRGLRLLICHLGSGCSAAAVKDGQAVATTMGFTPLEGLMMGTRPGSVDPGILLYLQRRAGYSAEDLDQALNHQSGLLGVSGIGADYRQVEAAAAEGHQRAQLALDIYIERICATIGGLVPALGGLDGLVFTAGVGEHSAALRLAVCRRLGFLGLEIDPEANGKCRPDADIATDTSQGRILVIRTREDLLIARQAARVVSLRP